MSDILSQKCVMLWDAKSGGVYLPALEREKQLLFFLLAYVAADKAARLPALRTLLQSLRLPLLGEAAPTTFDSFLGQELLYSNLLAGGSGSCP